MAAQMRALYSANSKKNRNRSIEELLLWARCNNSFVVLVYITALEDLEIQE